MISPSGLASFQLLTNSAERWREMEASPRGLESMWRSVDMMFSLGCRLGELEGVRRQPEP